MSVAVSAQDVEEFVNRQMQTYPKSRLLDIYKSCFQGIFECEIKPLITEKLPASK